MSNNYYKEMVRLADSIADKAHEGQTDHNGWPYISHPRRVALGARKLVCELAAATHPDTSLEELKAEAQIVALLHDTVNDLARLVKLADIADNTDPQRLALLEEPTRTCLMIKYEHSLKLLHLND